MGLEDITSDVEEETKEEEAEDLKDKLGVEDRESLKQLDQRLTDVMELATNLDNRMEQLEDDLQINRGAIVNLMKEIGNPEDSDIQQEKEDENPWLGGKNK